MKEHPRGSICTVISGYDEYKFKECTILGGLAERSSQNKNGEVTFGFRYEVTVQGYGDQLFHATHEQLRLKQYPGELHTKCEEFMKVVLKPVNIEETA